MSFIRGVHYYAVADGNWYSGVCHGIASVRPGRVGRSRNNGSIRLTARLTKHAGRFGHVQPARARDPGRRTRDRVSVVRAEISLSYRVLH